MSARNVPKKTLRGFNSMSRNSRTTFRTRISLLTSSSLVATTLLSGVGALTVTAFTPSVVLAAGCTPDAPGTTGPGSAVAATGIELCGTGPGIAYTATTGDLTMEVVGATIAPHGVFVNDDGGARNLSIAFDTTTLAAGPVTASTAGEDGIAALSSGGNVKIATGSSALGSLAGAVVTGDQIGIKASTTGAGTVEVDALNTVTGLNQNGIYAAAGTGSVKVITGTNTGGNVTVSGGGAFYGVFASGSGTIDVTTHGTVNNGIRTIGAPTSATTLTLNGDVTAQGAHILGAGSATVLLNSGNVNNTSFDTAALSVSATGPISVTTAANTTITDTQLGHSGIAIAGGGGAITGTINSTVVGDWATTVSNTGSGTISMTYNKDETGFNGGIQQTTVNGSNTLTLGNGVKVDGGNGGNAAIEVTASGSGAVDIEATGTGANLNKVVTNSAGGGNGITATSNSGSVTVNYSGDVGTWTSPTTAVAVGGKGIDAEIATGTAAINVTAGNVASVGVGIFAQNNGIGDVNVTTLQGTNVASTNNDGIDAWANGGNVTVTLLDGGVHANTSGNGPSGAAPSGGLINLAGAPAGSPLALDPNGVYAKTNGAGTVTVIAEDDVINNGPGTGILTQTVDGANTVNVYAKVSTLGGDGVNASSSGNGAVTVNLGTFTGVGGTTTYDVSTDTGNGVVARATSTGTTANVTINSTAPGNVLVTNGALGVGGVSAESSGTGGTASVNFSGPAGGTVKVDGAGSNFGIRAEGLVTGSAPSALVTLNDGLSVLVGTGGAGTSGSVGVLASTVDTGTGATAIVNLGNGDIITVGDLANVATESGNTGVSAIQFGGAGFGGGAASVTDNGGSLITVYGAAGVGVSAQSVSGFGAGVSSASVTLGDGGQVVVNDGGLALGSERGVQAIVSGGGVTASDATVTIGTTSVTVDDGVGILASTSGVGNVTVSTSGNVTSTNGEGIVAFTSGGATDTGVVTVNQNGGTVSTTNATNAIDATTGGTGGVVVTTLAGADVESTGNGINAQSFGTAGGVLVNLGGTIGATTATGGDGIDASIVNAANASSVQVNVNGNITAGASGVRATSDGVGNVQVTETSGVTITSGGPGIDASLTNGAAGGTVTVTADGAITTSGAGSQGVLATTATNGDLTVNQGVNGSITTTGGAANGIEAVNLTNANGSIFINPNGAISATGDGVLAVSNTNDNIEVNGTNALGTISAGLTGISAVHGGVGGGNVKVVYDGSITAGTVTAIGSYGIDAEILAPNFGVVDVTAGNITSTDDGIHAINTGGGNVTVTTLAGTSIVSTIGDGIDAEASGGNGSVNIQAHGNVTGDPGILATAVGTGAVNVDTFANVTGAQQGILTSAQNGPTTIGVHTAGSVVTGGVGFDGIQSFSTGGSIIITTDGGTNVLAGLDGVSAQSSTGNETFVINGTIGAGTATGRDGVEARIFNGASTGAITVTDNGAITATQDGIDALSFGSGIITVNTGAGLVTGNTGMGVRATSFGGANVGVTVGSGGVQGATDGVHVRTTNGGQITINSTAGQVTGGTGAGILATNVGFGVGSGSITINTAGVSATGAGGIGINASSTSGVIGITTGGPIVGDAAGILAATGGVGTTTVTTNIGSTVTANNGTGINATGGAAVTVTAHDTVTGTGGSGIFATATGATGTVTVQADKAVVGTVGAGIGAIAVNGAINVTANSTVAGGSFGIATSMTGGGSAVTNINALGAVTASAGDGINANTAGSGLITINAKAVTGTGGSGIVANATGGASIDVEPTGNVTATNGFGISATTSGGSGSVTINNAGAAYNVTGTTGGIVAIATNGGVVSVKQIGNVTTPAGNGIDAESSTGAVTVASSGGTISAGGTYGVFTDTNGAIGITNSSAVTGADIGIAAMGGPGAITINNSGSMAALTGTGGILASDTTGQISVTNSGQIGSTGAGNGVNVYGIAAQSLGANTTGVTVVNSGAIFVDGGPGTYGIFALNIGTGTVSVTNSGAIDPAAFGIWDEGGGNVITNNSGTILADTGIHSRSTGGTGTVTVNNSAAVTGTAGNGIEAIALGTGTVTVNNTGASAPISGSVNGILATGLGDVVVASGASSISGGAGVITDWGVKATSTSGGAGVGGAVSVSTGGVVSGAQGILAASNGTDATDTVSVTSGNTVSGALGVGIRASSASGAAGAVTVTAGVPSTVTAQTAVIGGTDGILATDAAGGGVSVTTTGNVTGTASTGVTATSSGGNGSVVVTTNNQSATVGNTVTGALDGILASSTGSGSTTVTANSAVTANGAVTATPAFGPVGISATSGTGGVTVNVNGAVSSAGRGVVTSSTGNGAINVGATGTIRGLGDATHAVVDITTGTAIGPSSKTTLTNAGGIASNGATLALQAADLAIVAKGGNLAIVNSGTINGRIDASGLTSVAGPPATTFFATLSNSGAWNTTGTSTLSGGADSVTNTATGSINTLGTTTVAFGAGADTLTNAGLIKVGGAGAATAAATLALTGLETFNNSGTIDLHDGVSPANRSLTATGTVFNGTGGTSLLYVDAFLGAPGSTADTLTIGSSTGSTAIRVNDTNPGLGSYNPTGIVVVNGSSAANTFTLSNLSSGFTLSANPAMGIPSGVLNKAGLFFYDLAFNAATNQELLISAPKAPAFQFAQIGAIAGDTWYTTTQSWFDRQADLRDTIGAHATGSQPAVWMKIVGSWGRRDSSQTLTLFNKTYTYDTSYRGDTAAVIGGVDLLNVTDKDKAWVVGVQGGYVDANERFRNSSTRLNLTGGVVGVYATFVQGGLFVDGIINGNILTGNWNIPGLGVTPAPWIASSHVNTWGGQLEAGYAFPIGASSFIEPVGSIAYGRTTVGQLNLPVGPQTFSNADTLRGSLGARVGTTAAFQYYKVKVALEGRVWDEFDGDTNALLNIGAPLATSNDISGVYGEIKGEANIFAVGNNLSAFVNTGVKWKTRYQDTSVTLGVRYQW